jgi:hypothetical protein
MSMPISRNEVGERGRHLLMCAALSGQVHIWRVTLAEPNYAALCKCRSLSVTRLTIMINSVWAQQAQLECMRIPILKRRESLSVRGALKWQEVAGHPAHQYAGRNSRGVIKVLEIRCERTMQS